MAYLTILPADAYIVFNKTILSNNDRKLITMLYQPIIGYTAVSLYFTLIDDLDKRELMSKDLTHYHLMTTMQLRLEEIVAAREKLEAAGLLKSYVKKDHINTYVYLLYSPLQATEFLNHPILNVVLYNNIGKVEYEKIVDYFKIPRISLKDYEDITKSFDEIFMSVPKNQFLAHDDIVEHNSSSLHVKSHIDMNLLISGIPKEMITERTFNEDVCELINNLSFTYDIDVMTMQNLVRDSLNEKGLVDKTEIRKSCRNFYQFENNDKLPTMVYRKQPEYLRKPEGDTSKWAKMVYTFENVNPYEYLKTKYNGARPTERDLHLIENLLVDQKMKPGVVNVLIAYVLKINHQKLSKSYVETIAGHWKRLNIETVEDAMRISEKEHKKLRKQLEVKGTTTPKVYKKNVPQESLPDWFGKELESEELTEEEKQEMNDLLKEFS